MVGSTYFLSSIRHATGQTVGTGSDDDDDGTNEVVETGDSEIPFTRVDLTFKDIRYIVKASTSGDKLELLKGIDGILEAGRMTALMGASGAGAY